MPDSVELTGIAFVAVGALVCGIVVTRFRQPAVIGYIFAGVLLGPSGLAFVENRDQISVLAELGVLMLLFLIGMELSLRGFAKVWRVAMMTTALQIAISVGIVLLLAQLFAWPLALTLLIGFAVSLSSTAVAIKILEDINELRTDAGRTAVGVLIAQDLAVVPMLLIIDGLAEKRCNRSPHRGENLYCRRFPRAVDPLSQWPSPHPATIFARHRRQCRPHATYRAGLLLCRRRGLGLYGTISGLWRLSCRFADRQLNRTRRRPQRHPTNPKRPVDGVLSFDRTAYRSRLHLGESRNGPVVIVRRRCPLSQ